MDKKLLIIKSKFYMATEDRKKLSDDIAHMAKNGAVVLGDEIEQITVIDLNNGTIAPIYSKQNNKCEVFEPKKEVSTLEKLFAKSNSEK